MSCTLLLLRHAKSDWSTQAQRDHERPLNDRGARAATLVGRFLDAVVGEPQRVVSSTAVRAQTTARRAADAAGWNVEIETSRSLYEASSAAVLAAARAAAADVSVQLLVGHEPSWSNAARELIGGGCLRLPTAGVIAIGFSGWNELAPGRGELLWLVTPKLLAAAGFE